MFVPGDWSVDRLTGDIRYIGDDHGGASPSYVSGLDFHRALQAFADDQEWTGDDELDITIDTPTDKKTDAFIILPSPFNIDDNAAEHLYGATISQNDGDDVYYAVINFGNVDKIQIVQDGAVIADDWWNLAAGGGLNPTDGVSHRFLVKGRAAGADIDGRKVVGTSRRWGYRYSEFTITSLTEGENVLALSEAIDLNNTLTTGAAAALTISNLSEGYTGLDISADGTDEFYYSQWNLDGNSANDLFEYAKYLTRDGSAETLYGLPGETFRGITHEISLFSPTGTFTEPEALSWSNGTGQLLAIDSTTAGTKMWIQLLTGTPPDTNGQAITGGTSGATIQYLAAGGVTEREISFPFVGLSTGSAIIGAYGTGMTPTDAGASDQFFDLTNTQVSPPVYATFTVSGLVAGEDRVFVAPAVAGDIEEDQLTLDGALTGAIVGAIDVNEAIPADTPASGTIRVQRDSGVYTLCNYSSWSGSTFTLASTKDFSADNSSDGSNTFVTYIDKLATATSETFTTVYDSDRDLIVRVRDGAASPIKPYESLAILTESGGSASAIRTSDA